MRLRGPGKHRTAFDINLFLNLYPVVVSKETRENAQFRKLELILLPQVLRIIYEVPTMYLHRAGVAGLHG